MNKRVRFAVKLAGYHLGANIVVAVLVAGVIFGIWYPYPYRQMLGGLELFFLVVCIDVVCGPILTAVLADPEKSVRAVAVDMGLVVLIQISALCYGLHTVAIARPVAVMFEVDRFVVVRATDIHQESLAKATASFNRLPWTGVERVAVRPPRDGAESNMDLGFSLNGVEPSARPDRWEADNGRARAAVRQKMRPLLRLQQHYLHNAELDSAVQKSGLPANKLYYLPFTSVENKGWTVLLDEQADFRGFVPLDAFF